MKIEFEFPELDDKTSPLIPEFCNMLVFEIRSEIKMNLRNLKLNIREDLLLNASWIRWINKPDHIDMIKLGLYIADSIVCRSIKENTYVIEINPKTYLPGSKTKLSMVARFLDRGDQSISPMYFINVILMKYRNKIREYWRSFIQIKLNRLNVNYVIIVR